jgi:ribosomal protein L11 methyltransferase
MIEPTEVPRYPYVAIDVEENDTDVAVALLFELGAEAIEQRDATTLARGAPGKVMLIASFERAEDARPAAGALPVAWSPRTGEVVGDAWRDEWKKHFEPFRLAAGIVVRPPWRAYDAKLGESVIVLEPGRAFGTGLHETTGLVAQALVDHAARFSGLPVLDVGCGSGILSLVAVVLGAARARAIDVDSEAVFVTRENAVRNGLGALVLADETALETVTERYAAVVANIDPKALVEMAPALMSRIMPGGLLVLAGILAPEVAPAQLAAVRGAYSTLREEEMRRNGEWVALVMSG